MKKTEEYRSRAEECRQMAEKAPTDEIKQTYLELARTWSKLAGERVELIIPAKEVDA